MKALTHLHSGTKIDFLELCREVAVWEEIGEYKEAARCLGRLWQGVGCWPDVEGLDDVTAGEVLLRVGSLSSWLGEADSLKGAQEAARDILGTAEARFTALGDHGKAAEAVNAVAITYWREGAYDNARAILSDAFKAQVGGEAYLRLVMTSAMVEFWDGRIDLAFRLYSSLENSFADCDNNALRVRYHLKYGVVLHKMGKPDEAIQQYEESLTYLDRLGNRRLRGNVINNIGFVYLQKHHYDKAHEYFSQAKNIFESFADEGSGGQVADSIAQLHLTQNNLPDAEAMARQAVAMLEKGDGAGFLAEALETLGKALARQGKAEEAVEVFRRAVSLAVTSLGSERATKISLLMIDEVTTPSYLEAGLTFDEAVHRFEEQLLRRALQESNKNMREAALKLGLHYETLRWVLNHRHRDLLGERTEIKRRKKSIISKASTKKKPAAGAVVNIADKRKR